jgi:hypothetical protein
MTSKLWLVTLAALVFVSGCGGDGSNTCSSCPGTDASVMAHDDLAAPTSGLSPDASCALLLSCLSTNAPTAFTTALSTYGPDGSCWKVPGAAGACHDACQAAVDQYAKNGLCCTADTQCPEAKPTCDLTKHACTTCPYACCNASACNGGVCDPTTHGCVGCLSSADCQGLICDPSTHGCVFCLKNADCPPPLLPFTPAAPICDPTDHQCVQCLADGDCGSHHCVAQACVECVKDGDCASGHCDGNSCLDCVTDNECGPGRMCRTGTCDKCSQDSDCSGATPHCANTGLIRECAQCNSATQCPSLPYCVHGFCAAHECSTSSDCPNDYICNGNKQCEHI